MKLSIVICTYNRAFYLQKCLNSIITQIASDSEIIVVDNNSTDNTREIVHSLQSTEATIRYIPEVKAGLSHARNKGLAEANGEWVCFIDDDVIIMKEYVNRALFLIKSRHYDFFGGKVIPLYLTKKPNWIPDTLNRFELNFHELTELKEGYVIGANMIMRKHIVTDLGGFSAQLGMQEGKIRYAEEDQIQELLRSEGYKIAYDPFLVVEHIVTHEKYSLRWHLKSKFAHARDSYQLCKNRKSMGALLFELFRTSTAALIKRLPYAIFKMVSDKNFYWQNGVLLVITPVISIAGKIATKMNSRES